MRKLDKIIIHCSDSDNPQHNNVDIIRQWHIQGHWRMNDIGYHFIILNNGTIAKGRHIEIKGAHVRGMNICSVGICLVGKYEFNDRQFESLKILIEGLCQVYNISRKEIYPHNAFNKHKTCPNFKIPDYFTGSIEDKK